MNADYIRKQLLEQHVRYSNEYSTYLEKAQACEDHEEKDTYYRMAAIAGLRLDSISKVTAVLNGKEVGLSLTREFQRHNRDMAKLKYRPRPAHLQSDALDMEVMSQFFQSDDAEQNEKYRQLMTGVKFKSRATGGKGSALATSNKGAYSEHDDGKAKTGAETAAQETLAGSGGEPLRDFPLHSMHDLESSPMLAAASAAMTGEISVEEQCNNTNIVAKKILQLSPSQNE